MALELHRGDRVVWDSSGGTAVGRAVRRITGTMQAAKRRVVATGQEPRYLVRSDLSCGATAHRPAALRRLRRTA